MTAQGQVCPGLVGVWETLIWIFISKKILIFWIYHWKKHDWWLVPSVLWGTHTYGFSYESADYKTWRNQTQQAKVITSPCSYAPTITLLWKDSWFEHIDRKLRVAGRKAIHAPGGTPSECIFGGTNLPRSFKELINTRTRNYIQNELRAPDFIYRLPRGKTFHEHHSVFLFTPTLHPSALKAPLTASHNWSGGLAPYPLFQFFVSASYTPTYTSLSQKPLSVLKFFSAVIILSYFISNYLVFLHFRIAFINHYNTWFTQPRTNSDFSNFSPRSTTTNITGIHGVIV